MIDYKDPKAVMRWLNGEDTEVEEDWLEGQKFGRRPIMRKLGRGHSLKKLHLIYACTLPLYLYAVYSILMHATQKTLSGNPPGDMPVIILIGVGVVVGWVARAKQARRDRERDEGMRVHVMREYPEGEGR